MSEALPLPLPSPPLGPEPILPHPGRGVGA